MASRGQEAHGLWPPEVWAWSPGSGRWQPEHGAPRRPVSFEVSTDGVEPHEAFEYWRHIAYYYFEPDRRLPGGFDSFRARADALITPRGGLYVYESSALSGQRTARQIRCDGGDTFDLGIVLAGRRRHRDEADGVTVAGPAEFFCYDAARASRVAWDDHRGLHLNLPRAMVEATVGKRLPPASQLVQALHHSKLAPFLRSHLSVLGRELRSLSLRERAAIYEVTVDLVLTVLREALSGNSRPSEMTLGAYFTAARRVIQERLADPNLTPEIIAGVLRCSRATLYRAFRAHGMTVADYIREVRLQEARRLICESSAGASIAKIAAQCGFCDPAYFRRLFRERFGMKPSDMRDGAGAAPRASAEHRSETSLHPDETN